MQNANYLITNNQIQPLSTPQGKKYNTPYVGVATIPQTDYVSFSTDMYLKMKNREPIPQEKVKKNIPFQVVASVGAVIGGFLAYLSIKK
jgi:hypothetical protein